MGNDLHKSNCCFFKHIFKKITSFCSKLVSKLNSDLFSVLDHYAYKRSQRVFTESTNSRFEGTFSHSISVFFVPN